MPFCTHHPSPAAFLRLPSSLRIHPFTSSAACWFAESRDPTYYEVLNVPVTATTQEIKKQFYALSLAHHPDKNPKDPKASARFASISNAYHVLANTTKRAKYDRDHDIHRAAAVSSSTRSGHRGSYVGSRPPSGLSKRRGPFRGPPPSFYAHGGYGAAPHHNHPHHAQQHQHPGQEHQHQQSHGSDPSSFIHHNPVPHFNATSHFRTQTHEDTRRRERRRKAIDRATAEAAERGVDEAEYTTSRLLMVLGIVGLAWATLILGQKLEGPRSPPLSYSAKKAEEHGPVTGSTTTAGSRLQERREQHQEHSHVERKVVQSKVEQKHELQAKL
ncbi:predicted protein [Uncinocarpus reesii 1704]|uniref:J domain-containing protein n=1 Tax=Uncinocarpus reesii (strain UAMH 1704) TaxID=336963 RepID=C4JSX4_UNCRE|nr:uncharacterized protein UREG_05563 [Uncinocarpus reesii 1704]EEP80721.1 predicted protein [Uncinocarpus reesii 1704]